MTRHVTNSSRRYSFRRVCPHQMPAEVEARIIGSGSAFGVGMIHGIGAETPTQVLIFLAAADAGGKGSGLLLLGCFLIGLLSSHTVVAVAGTFLGATQNFRVYAAVSIVTAAFSLSSSARCSSSETARYCRSCSAAEPQRRLDDVTGTQLAIRSTAARKSTSKAATSRWATILGQVACLKMSGRRCEQRHPYFMADFTPGGYIVLGTPWGY